MTTLGFDAYVEPLKLYLQKYREVSKKVHYCCGHVSCAPMQFIKADKMNTPTADPENTMTHQQQSEAGKIKEQCIVMYTFLSSICSYPVSADT